MSESVLNTPEETKYRLLLLLSVLPDAQYDQQWISAMDFLSIYGADFDYDGANLHGDSWMRFTEYALRIWNVRDALHEMVMMKWLTVKPSSGGYMYSISRIGQERAAEFSTSFAAPYKKNASDCFRVYGNRSGKELDGMIRDAGLKMMERRKAHD